MKIIPRALAILGLLGALASAHGVTPPKGVTVTYALVPKERLADAVRDSRVALAIEESWRKDMMAKPGPPGYPINLSGQKYSIVVFVEMPASFALWGKIGLPIQNPKNPVVLNVSQAPGYSGTYVIDGGGLVLTRGILTEPKSYEWLEVNTK